jgi:serine protease AprX
MATDAVISPSFEEIFATSDENEVHDAIVVLRPPQLPRRLRGSLRELDERIRYIEEQAAARREPTARALQEYAEEGGRKVPGRRGLEASLIGSSSLPIAAAEVTQETIGSLAKLDDVLVVLPDQPVHLIAPRRADPAQSPGEEAKQKITWGLARMEVDRVWQTTRGEAIKVAVLDTGVHADHPALQGRVRDFVVVDPLRRRIAATPPFDFESHGTHVCGTIAGQADGSAGSGIAIGVAPDATLMVAAVLLGETNVRMIVEAMDWAVQQGADIISMSFGFTYYEPYFAEVLRPLVEEFEILPVVAIGNENHGNTRSPGNAHNALAVGAAEERGGNLEVCFFSSGASLVFPGKAPGLVTKPDIVAPGRDVYSCVPNVDPARSGYEYMNGTSMATPHVAGAAALLMAAKPNARVAEIVGALKETAEHPAGTQIRPDNRWGYGFVRPAEALRALG